MLLSFGTQFVGFAARPIGAAIFGHYGDRIGRKAALIATLCLMGVATVLMGVLPGYATIGIWAPILLALLRIVQGIGVGGEWGGSVLHVDGVGLAASGAASWRACRSWASRSACCSRPLAVRIVSGYQTGDSFETWGWRIPFLLSIVLVGIGFYVRLRRPGEPRVRPAAQGGDGRQAAGARGHPHPAAGRSSPRRSSGWPSRRRSTCSSPSCWPTATEHLELDRRTTCSTTRWSPRPSGFVSVPLFGYLSDLIGRRLVYGIGIVLHRPLRLPVLRAAQHQGERPRPAGDRACR